MRGYSFSSTPPCQEEKDISLISRLSSRCRLACHLEVEEGISRGRSRHSDGQKASPPTVSSSHTSFSSSPPSFSSSSSGPWRGTSCIELEGVERGSCDGSLSHCPGRLFACKRKKKMKRMRCADESLCGGCLCENGKRFSTGRKKLLHIHRQQQWSPQRQGRRENSFFLDLSSTCKETLLQHPSFLQDSDLPISISPTILPSSSSSPLPPSFSLVQSSCPSSQPSVLVKPLGSSSAVSSIFSPPSSSRPPCCPLCTMSVSAELSFPKKRRTCRGSYRGNLQVCSGEGEKRKTKSERRGEIRRRSLSSSFSSSDFAVELPSEPPVNTEHHCQRNLSSHDSLSYMTRRGKSLRLSSSSRHRSNEAPLDDRHLSSFLPSPCFSLVSEAPSAISDRSCSLLQKTFLSSCCGRSRRQKRGERNDDRRFLSVLDSTRSRRRMNERKSLSRGKGLLSRGKERRSDPLLSLNSGESFASCLTDDENDDLLSPSVCTPDSSSFIAMNGERSLSSSSGVCTPHLPHATQMPVGECQGVRDFICPSADISSPPVLEQSLSPCISDNDKISSVQSTSHQLKDFNTRGTSLRRRRRSRYTARTTFQTDSQRTFTSCHHCLHIAPRSPTEKVNMSQSGVCTPLHLSSVTSTPLSGVHTPGEDTLSDDGSSNPSCLQSDYQIENEVNTHVRFFQSSSFHFMPPPPPPKGKPPGKKPPGKLPTSKARGDKKTAPPPPGGAKKASPAPAGKTSASPTPSSPAVGLGKPGGGVKAPGKALGGGVSKAGASPKKESDAPFLAGPPPETPPLEERRTVSFRDQPRVERTALTDRLEGKAGNIHVEGAIQKGEHIAARAAELVQKLGKEMSLSHQGYDHRDQQIHGRGKGRRHMKTLTT
ncbi:hypothetical protein CSUI_000427 [Cystoisospora suis]|uniref:Uncharacterized protein n=1 Tax=Cystoisospora suis TaxID=483139 RepID=A0A2C6LH70_9APIC|nr:hypothetical protein CSUI_000427 [Cystoisospora suis]